MRSVYRRDRTEEMGGGGGEKRDSRRRGEEEGQIEDKCMKQGGRKDRKTKASKKMILEKG